MITGGIIMLFEQALVVCATVCATVCARVFVCICVYFDTRIHALYILFISFCIAFNKFFTRISSDYCVDSLQYQCYYTGNICLYMHWYAHHNALYYTIN